MHVLWQHEHKRVTAQSFFEVAERDARKGPAVEMALEKPGLFSGFDHRVGDSELAVEFEAACVNDHRARRRTCFRRLVDNAQSDAEAAEPERQDEPGRPGADDQDLPLFHFSAERFRSTASRLARDDGRCAQETDFRAQRVPATLASRGAPRGDDNI